MSDFWYSTNPFLAWCFSHCFFGGRYFSWVASPFYTYRLPNPPSSNPFLLYGDLYMAWKDNDVHSKIIKEHRISARNAIAANKLLLNDGLARRLEAVGESVSVELFLPVVYRVDLDAIEPRRLTVAKSGITGSKEYLIRDLRDGEFDLLFMEDSLGTCVEELMDASSPDEALTVLEARCS